MRQTIPEQQPTVMKLHRLTWYIRCKPETRQYRKVECNSEWEETKANIRIEAITGCHKRITWLEITHGKQQPECVNRYNLLHNLKEATEVKESVGLERKRVLADKGRVLMKKKHKVILIWPSHARRCAAELTRNLENPFEVTGYVKPGMGLEVITNPVTEENDNLTRDNAVTVWGGAI